MFARPDGTFARLTQADTSTADVAGIIAAHAETTPVVRLECDQPLLCGDVHEVGSYCYPCAGLLPHCPGLAGIVPA